MWRCMKSPRFSRFPKSNPVQMTPKHLQRDLCTAGRLISCRFFSLSFELLQDWERTRDGRACHRSPAGSDTANGGVRACVQLVRLQSSSLAAADCLQRRESQAFNPGHVSISAASHLLNIRALWRSVSLCHLWTGGAADLSTSASARGAVASGDWRHLGSSLPPPAEMIMRSLIE